MIRIFLAVSVLALFAFAAMAEDLGELAKKEKARREALARQGKKSKTLTNADIPNIKSELAIQQTSPPAGEIAAELPADEAEQESASSELERLKTEKEKLEEQKEEIKENIGNTGLFFGTRIGAQYGEIRKTEEKIKETEEKIEEEKQEEKD